MSQQSQRVVPKWPIINFGNNFAFDVMSMLLGMGAGAAVFYVVQKFVLKKCVR